MRIYTGRGDAGRTDLRDATRVSKADPRIEATGTVDELNALLGTVRPTGHSDVDDRLAVVQNDLFVVQATLANPVPDGDTEAGDPRVTADHVRRVEGWMDGYDEELDALTRFVLPGGSAGGAALHHARTVARRAERRVVALAAEEAVPDPVTTYLNRLSDLLFVLARVVNARDGVPEEHPTY